MKDSEELNRLLTELEKATGLHMQVEIDSQEKLDSTLIQVRQLLSAYKEKYDKNYFLRSLMLGKIDLTEAEQYAKKMHIENEENRVLFLIETKQIVDDFLVELLKNIFPLQNKNYIVKMNHHQVVLLKPSQLEGDELLEESMAVARMIVDTVNAEAMFSVRVSYSSCMEVLSDAAVRYSESLMAMKIGNVFYSEQLIVPYNQLGVGGMIYQLPKDVCVNFLNEIFGSENAGVLDEEMKMTVSKFFQYNLNIAETSRQLHMHRNTLIYRIEQLQKRTGLDIRVFEEACVFQIAMMVMNYMKSN